MSTSSSKMNSPFTTGQFYPPVFPSERKGDFYAKKKKVPLQGYNHKRLNVRTLRMCFYHRSPYKPIYM